MIIADSAKRPCPRTYPYPPPPLLIPRQVNFLCDEAGGCGKGANTMVSQLNVFFDHHGLGRKKKVFLHADKAALARTRTILCCLPWRVMTGRQHPDHPIFLGGRSHQVCPGLVLWPVQAAVSEDKINLVWCFQRSTDPDTAEKKVELLKSLWSPHPEE